MKLWGSAGGGHGRRSLGQVTEEKPGEEKSVARLSDTVMRDWVAACFEGVEDEEKTGIFPTTDFMRHLASDSGILTIS
jgi:hypothetical protein